MKSALVSCIGVGLAALLTASPAAATTICITPASNPGICANHTFAAAVAQAHSGDIIRFAPGTYYENAVVPNGLDFLQILGTSKASTIIDAGDNSAIPFTATTGIGLKIYSQHVTVKGFTFRNGAVGIDSIITGLIVSGNSFVGQTTAGVNSGGNGDVITGNDAHQLATGFASLGIGTVISRNTITNAQQGIVVQGPSSQVLSNKVYNGSVGIYAQADAPVIKGNDVRYQEIGIYTLGGFPTVQLNMVQGTMVGVSSGCTPCFGGTIASNVITDASEMGIGVFPDAPGLSVVANSVSKSGTGIVVQNNYGPGTVTGVLVESNRVSDAGNGWSDTDFAGNHGSILGPHCFSSDGDGNLFSRNIATRCSGSGFYINAGNDLDLNVISGALDNGITMDGCNFHDPSSAPCMGPPHFGGNITRNKATGNGGQGIAIMFNSQWNYVELNTATGNRKLPPLGTTSLDFCDDNRNGTNFYGNSFPDPGGPVACTILH
jgi:parallel beta-helix repeat protein